MKILSDWHTGTPPMPGLWLVRAVVDRKWTFGTMMRWNEYGFVLPDGVRACHAGPHIEWRGLAFDPEKAVPWINPYGEKTGWWLVDVPQPKGRRNE